MTWGPGARQNRNSNVKSGGGHGHARGHHAPLVHHVFLEDLPSATRWWEGNCRGGKRLGLLLQFRLLLLHLRCVDGRSRQTLQTRDTGQAGVAHCTPSMHIVEWLDSRSCCQPFVELTRGWSPLWSLCDNTSNLQRGLTADGTFSVRLPIGLWR